LVGGGIDSGQVLVAALLLHHKAFIVRLVDGNQVERGLFNAAHDVVVRMLHDKTVAAVFLQSIKIQVGFTHALQKHAAECLLCFGCLGCFYCVGCLGWFLLLNRVEHDVCAHTAFCGQLPTRALVLSVGFMVKHVDHGALHELFHNEVVIRKLPACHALGRRECHDFSVLVQHHRPQKPEGLQLVALQRARGVFQNGMHVRAALPFLVCQITFFQERLQLVAFRVMKHETERAQNVGAGAL
jgi:hypothetical protein